MISHEWIKHFRENVIRMTQEELAEKLYCDRTLISHIERGHIIANKTFINSMLNLKNSNSPYKREIYFRIKEDLYERWLK